MAYKYGYCDGFSDVPCGSEATETTPIGGKLGCSQHVAYIQAKCNGPRLCELTDITELGYDRRLDDISQAFVEIPISGDSDHPCCTCLADVEPWCHVLTIVREGDGVVWTGPVQKVTYGYNSVRIEAADKLAWLEKRIIPYDLTIWRSNPTFIKLTTIAWEIVNIAMADDDSSCFMKCVVDPFDDGFPANAPRNVEYIAFEGSAYDTLLKVKEAGIDFTVVNQCLIFKGEALPKIAIGTLLDEHILGELNVIKDGALLANRVYVRWEKDQPCDDEGEEPCYDIPWADVLDADLPCYGRIEALVEANGNYTKGMAQQTADTFLAASKIVPRRIEFPAGTRLSPDTPWELNDMIPGQRIDVALTKMCLPVFQSFKLQQVTVVDGPEGEEISIDLTALTTGAND